MEDDPRGLGIDPDVELGGGSDVADAAGCSAHHHATANGGGKLRLAQKSHRQIGERAQGDDFDAGIFPNGLDQRVAGMIWLRSALGRLVSVIAETVGAVEPVGGDQLSLERPLRSGIHRHVRGAEFRGVQGIAGGLRDGNIAGNDGDGGDADLLGTQGHDQRHGIVGGGVGVNEKRSSHPGGATIEESDGEFALPSVTSLRPRIQKKLRSGANSAPRGGSLRWIERRPSQRVLRESPARTMQGSLAC